MSSPFPLPLAFSSQAFKKTRQPDGSLLPDDSNAAYNVAKAMHDGGFRTLAVQIGPTGYDACADADDVASVKRAFQTLSGGQTLTVIAWGVVDGNTASDLARLGVTGWLPQVEGDGQRDALIAALKAGVGSGLPKALVTTYGGLDQPTTVNELKAVWPGPFVFVECYAADGHSDVGAMLQAGRNYGFSDLRGITGTYRGELPGDYRGVDGTTYGGVFLEEPMSAAQLAAWAAIVPVDPPPAPAPTPAPAPAPAPVNDAADRNAKIAAIADAWLAEFGARPLYRLECISQIAHSDDTTWNAKRQDVADALSGAVAALRAELADTQAKLDAANAKADGLQSTIDAVKPMLAGAMQRLGGTS